MLTAIDRDATNSTDPTPIEKMEPRATIATECWLGMGKRKGYRVRVQGTRATGLHSWAPQVTLMGTLALLMARPYSWQGGKYELKS